LWSTDFEGGSGGSGSSFWDFVRASSEDGDDEEEEKTDCYRWKERGREEEILK